MYSYVTETCGQETFSITPVDIVNLTSPEYPNPFRPSTACTWTISSTNYGLTLIKFIDFSIYNGFDFVYVGFEDTIISSLSGNSAPAAMIVNSTENVKVTFDAYLWDNGFRGFWLELSWTTTNGISTYYLSSSLSRVFISEIINGIY